MNRNLLIALVLVTIGQVLTFFQSQGQFIWTWAKNNTFAICLMGIPVSYLFIKFVKYCAFAFGGQVWPGRLIGFAIGAMVFTLMSWFFLKEPINTKTAICLGLAVLILLVQIFWK